MTGYPYGESSSSAPPPPYSVSAPDAGSGDPGSTSSSLHPPVPSLGHGASGAAPSKGSHSAFGVLDSKWRLADPRSSSAQSLAPSVEDRTGDSRRTLLIIYIHGFYGNESSFRSFPAHVHNYLKEALVESHFVHSKIYPRYKTYKAIDVARDNFSAWLEPHESESTDVILVGHSMGGLLAAEVVLMPNRHPYRRQPFKHRILGTISLDSPFLGLHPGIVVAGISSLFRPASPPPEENYGQGESSSHLSPANSALTSPNPSMPSLEAASSLGAEMSPSPSNTSSVASSGPPPKPDPFFNPPFFNDVSFKDRSFMRRLGHFAKKHGAEGIWDATKNHLMSHLEYGGCLADYPGLTSRYNKLRALEDFDPLAHLDGYGKNINNHSSTRVRFVNYYTLSTGRPKKPKSPKSSDLELGSEPPSTLDVTSQLSPQAPSTPRISVENSDDGERTELLSSIEAVEEKLSTLHEEQQAKFDRKAEEANATKAHEAGTSEQQVEPKGKGKEKVDDSVRLDEGLKGKGKENVDDAESHDYVRGEDSSPPNEEDLRETPPEPIPNGDGPADDELPPIPDLPEPPSPPDLDRYTDKDARKQAEKEAKRIQKAYDQAVKIREKAIKERQKLVEKRRKRAEKEAQKEAQRLEKEEQRRKKQEVEEQKKQEEEADQRTQAEEAAQKQAPTGVVPEAEPAAESHTATAALAPPTGRPPLPPRTPSAATSMSPSIAPQSSAASIATTQTAATAASRGTADPGKPKKERKFCTLPRKTNGRRDETWVPVFMEGVDEVGAHCGLFLPGPHYDTLIGDVGERIVGWVQEDLTVRAIVGMS